MDTLQNEVERRSFLIANLVSLLFMWCSLCSVSFCFEENYCFGNVMKKFYSRYWSNNRITLFIRNLLNVPYNTLVTIYIAWSYLKLRVIFEYIKIFYLHMKERFASSLKSSLKRRNLFSSHFILSIVQKTYLGLFRKHTQNSLYYGLFNYLIKKYSLC